MYTLAPATLSIQTDRHTPAHAPRVEYYRQSREQDIKYMFMVIIHCKFIVVKVTCITSLIMIMNLIASLHLAELCTVKHCNIFSP